VCVCVRARARAYVCESVKVCVLCACVRVLLISCSHERGFVRACMCVVLISIITSGLCCSPRARGSVMAGGRLSAPGLPGRCNPLDFVDKLLCGWGSLGFGHGGVHGGGP